MTNSYENTLNSKQLGTQGEQKEIFSSTVRVQNIKSSLQFSSYEQHTAGYEQLSLIHSSLLPNPNVQCYQRKRSLIGQNINYQGRIALANSILK